MVEIAVPQKSASLWAQTNLRTPFSGSGFEPATLIDLLSWRATHQPGREAYTFLGDGEAEERSVNYRDMDRRARSVASRLQNMGVATGERVLLLYPPGLEYVSAFLGCLYAGVIAVPAYPPRLSRPISRLRAIAADSKAKVALTTTHILSSLGRGLAHAPEMKSLLWLAPDDSKDSAREWRCPEIDGNTLAFLQYTSGSTAAPKGVMVTHANLLHNEGMIRRAFGQSAESVIVGWLPLHHDMGLIGNVLQPLYLGARCILMTPVAFLQRPLRWLAAISRYRGTTSGGP